MNKALEIVRFSTSRNYYIKAQRGIKSAYVALEDIEGIILDGTDYTMHCPKTHNIEKITLTSIILNKEKQISDGDVNLMNRIIRSGDVATFIKSLEK